MAARAFAVALLAVPRAWRDMVRDDLAEQFGPRAIDDWRRAVSALVIATSLHWEFTRGAALTDVHDAARSLVRAKGFAIGAIATFALGIGVNLAVFSAVDRMLFRPLPYADPDRLVVMGLNNASLSTSRLYGTVPLDETIRARESPLVASLANVEWTTDAYRLSPIADAARYLRFLRVSYTTLSTLGVRPIVGRDFTEDDARFRRRALLLRESVWRHDFGGRADVVGRRAWSADVGQDGEVVGVLPDAFFPPQVYIPTFDWSGLAVDEMTYTSDGPRAVSTAPIVRLAPGVSLETAQMFVSSIEADHRARAPVSERAVADVRLILLPIRTAVFGRYNSYLGLTFAAAMMVLLVGCANLASLLLVRARSREHRSALQMALGASATRVIRSAMAEAFVLAVVGSAVAVLVLKVADRAIAAWLPKLFSAYASPVLEPRVLMLTGTLAFVCALVAGALPGWRASRVDVLTILNRGTGRIGSGTLRGGASILACEIAISIVLVACAALAGQNLVRLTTTDVGYDPDHLVHVNAWLPSSTDPVRLRSQYGAELDVLRAIPSVRSAAGADTLPNLGALGNAMGDERRQGYRYAVTDGFVETMGMRLLAGRSITAAEVKSLAPVGVLSESALHLLWPDLGPSAAIGRQMRLTNDVPREVVGVVSDVRGDYTATPLPSLFVPSGSDNFRFMDFAVRLEPRASLSVSDVTRRLADAGFAPTRLIISPFAKSLADGVVNQRFRAELLSGFGLVALVLAMVGLYAVQSFNVTKRTTEFGVRVSLGATPADLRALLIRQTLAPACAGIAIGLLATLWVARYLQSLLDVVSARDPWTYAGVACALLAASVAATLIPARRAAKTDPVIALRAQ